MGYSNDGAYEGNGYSSNRYGNNTTSSGYGNNPGAYQDNYGKNGEGYNTQNAYRHSHNYQKNSGKQLGVKGSLLLVLIATIATVYMLYFS